MIEVEKIKASTVMVRFPDGDRAVPSHMAETDGYQPGAIVAPMFVNTPDPIEGWRFSRVVGATPIDWQAFETGHE